VIKEIIIRGKPFLREKFIHLILKKKNKIKEDKSWRKDPPFYHKTPALTQQKIKFLQTNKEFTIKIPLKKIKP
jgi:hypothetical protein